MHCVLINLTRLGDLLQMQPLIAGMREHYAQKGRPLTISLVCLENFVQAAQMLQGVDTVYPLAGASLLRLTEYDWPKAIVRFVDFFKPLLALGPLQVYNYTPTLAARVFSQYLATANTENVVHGFALDNEGFGVNADPWTAFLQAATQKRGCSPFNITDIFRMVAQSGTYSSENTLVVATASKQSAQALLQQELAATNAPDTTGFVGFQLGASENRRRWSLAHFARLGALLWNKHKLVPVLLGAHNELPLAERFADLCSTPFISLMGKTALAELAGVLQELRLLVTNDTGTMHLAAGVQTPIVSIFLATAQAWDTGAYLEGSLALEPDIPCHPCEFGTACPHGEQCRTVIQPELVAELTEHILAQQTTAVSQVIAVQQATGARIWQAYRETLAISNTFTETAVLQHYSLLNLHSLSGHEQTDRTVWVRMQRHFYYPFLNRQHASAFTTATAEVEYCATAPNLFGALSAEYHAAAKKILHESVGLLQLAEQQSMLLQMKPSEQNKSRFLASINRVKGLWLDSPLFSVLGLLWNMELSEAGGDLTAITNLIHHYKGLTVAWNACLE